MSIVIWPLRPSLIYPEDPTPWVEAVRTAAGGLEVVPAQSEAQALAAAPSAEAWIGSPTPAMFAAAPKLRWLQAPSVSLEKVLFPELAASAVTLTNLSHVFDDFISMHVLAMFVALCRDFPRLMQLQGRREWLPRLEVRMRIPETMTAVIVGMGGIGTATAGRIAALGTTIIGVDPVVTVPPPGVSAMATPDRLAELLPRADAVIVCAPETPQTIGLFDDAMFGKMRADAFFINIGRGRIVRLAALERALAEKRLGGAALDVFEVEPLPASSPLWTMENVLLTPHVAGTGDPRTHQRRVEIIVDNVGRFIEGRPLRNVVEEKGGGF